MTPSQPMKLLFAAAIVVYGVAPAAAADITVQVTGLRNQAGGVIVALHDSVRSFPSRWEGALSVRRATAGPGPIAITFENVPDGRYAVIAVHDEDGDGKMSKSFIGLPQEGFGTSNNPSFFGPPRFSSAVVDIRGSTTIRIQMVYF